MTDLAAPPLALLPGLAPLASRYAGLVCDVWGVLHDGLVAYPAAVDALKRFRRETGNPVMLLTNAPRRAEDVARQIARFGVPRDAYDGIVSSGDATRRLVAASGAKSVLYIGPDRDRALLAGLDIDFVEAGAEIIVCTGPFDDDIDVPEDYRERFEAHVAAGLPFYCANPDLVVERGSRLVYCAGALAALYEALGGTTIIIGKPHRPVYDVTMAHLAERAGRTLDPAEVLAIGDAIVTDAKGASDFGLDLLFVTGGIHAADFGPPDAPNLAAVRTRLAAAGVSAVGAMPKLAW